MASAFALRLRARWLSSGPADSQPVASDTRNHVMLLCVCKCMLLCECMCTSLARLACVQRACRACCARVCSCARRRAASVGEACEAKPGARHASSPFHPFYPRVKWLTSYSTFVPRVKNPPPRRSSLRVWSLLPVSLPNRCAVRNRAASVAACLRCSRHHRAVYRHGQKRTHSCAYISATTSPASGCKAICESCIFASR